MYWYEIGVAKFEKEGMISFQVVTLELPKVKDSCINVDGQNNCVFE